MFNFGPTHERIKEFEEHLSKDLGSIRTGRATPVVLDSISVEAYGSKMSMRELGNITIEDARSIKFEPWDKSVLKEVEKAIQTSGTGLSCTTFDGGIRIIFPELTEERRKEFVKTAKSKGEEAKIRLRQLRDKVWGEIQEKEKEGGMGEDDKFRLKAELQKLVDEASAKVVTAIEKKEKEILG